ncbi:hypothetical protein M407DRAFT_12015 [Tulasnella calospora MUT 4182]|uniref:F-box domain-containing protein n=1 Tax=Tulasnella calospora MUT 4182 TaxID=1051891 RepID=A0A0C3K9S8_9AGAM|nr:hypothetical protein M407DRAFT_12015 [Tulasnella calospora MUT 4182]
MASSSTLSKTTNLRRSSRLHSPERFLKSPTQSRFTVSASNSRTDHTPSDASLFPSLPEDIIILIAQFLTSRKDQLAFIKTCHAFQDAGTRMLYAHIEIRHSWPEFDPLLATLYHRPDFVRHIRTYCGPLQIFLLLEEPMWKARENLGSQPRKPGHELGREGDFPLIFKHATGIRELKIFDDRKVSFGEQTLATIRQMPLTKLIVVHQPEEHGAMPLTKVLGVQQNIRQLELHGDVSHWDLKCLKEGDLPNLESLAARVGPAKMLVPGRPITSVEIHNCHSETEGKELWMKLSQSSATVLKLDIWEWNAQQLEQAAFYLPNIRHLRFRGYHIKVDEVVKAVSYFPDLETLDISTLLEHQDGQVTSPQVSYDPDLSSWDRYTPSIFQNSKTLAEINIWKYGSFRFGRASANAVH